MINNLYTFLYQPLSQFEIVLGNSSIFSIILVSFSYVKDFESFLEMYFSYTYLNFLFHNFLSVISFIFIFDFSTQIIGPSTNSVNFVDLINIKQNVYLENQSFYHLIKFFLEIRKDCLNYNNPLPKDFLYHQGEFTLSPFIYADLEVAIKKNKFSSLSHLKSFFILFFKDLVTFNFSNISWILYCFTLLLFVKIFQFSVYFFNNDVFIPYIFKTYEKNIFNKNTDFLNFYFIDYSITKFHTTVFFILFFFFIFFVLNLKKEFFFRPSINFILFGLIDKFLTNTIVQQLGIKRGQEFSVVLKTFFFLILFANLFGLIPFSFTITSHLVFTFGLSFAIISTITIFGFYKQGSNFLNLLIPGGAPKALLPILIPIELLSYIVRCFSLAIRLFANMMSGHSLLYILSGFVIQITAAGFFLIALAPFFIVLLIGILEIGVAMLQAYVFLVLTCIYLRDGYQAGH